MKKEYPSDTTKSVRPGILNHMEGKTAETGINGIRGERGIIEKMAPKEWLNEKKESCERGIELYQNKIEMLELELDAIKSLIGFIEKRQVCRIPPECTFFGTGDNEQKKATPGMEQPLSVTTSIVGDIPQGQRDQVISEHMKIMERKFKSAIGR